MDTCEGPQTYLNPGFYSQHLVAVSGTAHELPFIKSHFKFQHVNILFTVMETLNKESSPQREGVSPLS